MNKAPDKIYVDTEIIAFYDLEIEGPEDTVYIRKDALLEWVEETRSKVCRSIESIGVLDDLIEKLNSM